MAKTADAKTKLYSKYAREIYVCAKGGGIDPSANLSLRGLIDRAKKDQVPAHVIDKAIDKAKGGGGEDFAIARYEGFGPGGCTVIVECLTDNPNRTFGDVRVCFNKCDCKIGTPGSVSHMFDHSAILVFDHGDEEMVLETLLMADVDVQDLENEDGRMTVFAPHTEYSKARNALVEAIGEIDFHVDEIQFVPHNMVSLGDDDRRVMAKFLDMLNDLDDVQNVYHNASDC